MTALFNRLFGKKQSKEIASERLRLVLMGDRGISAALLEKMKEDIIGVLSRYIEFEGSGPDIRLTQTENEDGTAVVPALVASIPVRSLRGRQSDGAQGF